MLYAGIQAIHADTMCDLPLYVFIHIANHMHLASTAIPTFLKRCVFLQCAAAVLEPMHEINKIISEPSHDLHIYIYRTTDH